MGQILLIAWKSSLWIHKQKVSCFQNICLFILSLLYCGWRVVIGSVLVVFAILGGA